MEHDINKIYWSYNLPLQLWPHHADPEDETSELIGYRILNYIPRKEKCVTIDLDEDILNGQTDEEFFIKAAEVLENLARLFRKAAVIPGTTIYYPDEEVTTE